MKMSESIGQFAAALSKFQAKVQQPKKDAKNPQFNSSYVPFEGIVVAAAPMLGEFGLSYVQDTRVEGEDAVVQTLVMHESGEWIMTSPLSLPAFQMIKGGGKAFNAQAVGSSLTYAKRYQLGAALGISAEVDDDGNDASKNAGRDSKPYTKPAHSSGASSNGAQPSGNTNNRGNSNNSADVATDAQKRGIKGKMSAKGMMPDEAKAMMVEMFGKQSSTELTKVEASKLMDAIEKWEPAPPEAPPEDTFEGALLDIDPNDTPF